MATLDADPRGGPPDQSNLSNAQTGRDP